MTSTVHQLSGYVRIDEVGLYSLTMLAHTGGGKTLLLAVYVSAPYRGAHQQTHLAKESLTSLVDHLDENKLYCEMPQGPDGSVAR